MGAYEPQSAPEYLPAPRSGPRPSMFVASPEFFCDEGASPDHVLARTLKCSHRVVIPKNVKTWLENVSPTSTDLNRLDPGTITLFQRVSQ